MIRGALKLAACYLEEMKFFVDLYFELVHALSLRLNFFHFLFVLVYDVIIECLKLTFFLLYDFSQ